MKVYQLTPKSDQYFWVAAYPYSGVDTIDLYCFVHNGPRQWRVQMLYFALRPKTRTLTVLEHETSMIVKDGDQELVRVAIKPGPKMTKCVENLYAMWKAKFEWAEDKHKEPGDKPKWSDLKHRLEEDGVANGIPICPQGGSYELGDMQNLPRCSKGGPDHSLPLP